MTEVTERITTRVRIRRNAMLWAYLTFAAKKLPIKDREHQTWAYLLEWASLGGTQDEVIA